MIEPQLHDLVEKWVSRLDMEQWQIAVRVRDAVLSVTGEPVAFRMNRSTHYQRGSLEVQKAILNDEWPDCIENDLILEGVVTHEEYIEISVVHELLHLLLRDLLETSDSIREHLGAPVAALWDSMWRRAEEVFVENLAIALVRNWNS